MSAAVLIWVIYSSVLALGLSYALKRARPGLVAVLIMLVLLTALRPPQFFFGLDLPLPQSHFDGVEAQLVQATMLVCCVWLGCLLLAYGIAPPLASKLVWLLPKGPNTLGQVQRRALWTAIMAPLVLALVGSFYLAYRSGGFGGMIYASKIGKELAGLFLFKEAATLAALLSIFGLITFRGKGLGFVVVIVIACVANFMWGGRYNIALILLTAGIAWHWAIRPLRATEVCVSLLLGIGLLQALKALRWLLFNDVSGGEYVLDESIWRNLSTSLHMAEFDALMLALRDAGDRFDLRAGADFINGLLSWVPRSLYPEKETFHIGGWFRQIYQPAMKNGWPVTVIGAWYVNFGYIGVPLGAIISGIVVRVYDAVFSDPRGSAWHATIGTGLALFMLEGGVSTGFPQRIALLILPLAAVSWWLRAARHRPALS